MSPTSGYTEQELMQMQQDALRRVQEMNERAKRTVEQGGWRSQDDTPTPTAPIPPPPAQPTTPPQNTTTPPPTNRPTTDQSSILSQLGGLLGGGGGQVENGASPLSGLMQWAGGERGILLGLLGVLMSERADPTLLLAMFYLAMGDGGERDTDDRLPEDRE